MIFAFILFKIVHFNVITTANLMNIRQQANKLSANFFQRFRKMAEKCPIKFPDVEYASTVINMHTQLKDKLLGQTYHDVFF